MTFTNCSPYILCLNTLEFKFFFKFKNRVKQLLIANYLFIFAEFIFVTDFWSYGYCEIISNVFRLILWFQQPFIFLYGRSFSNMFLLPHIFKFAVWKRIIIFHNLYNPVTDFKAALQTRFSFKIVAYVWDEIFTTVKNRVTVCWGLVLKLVWWILVSDFTFITKKPDKHKIFGQII